MERKEEALIKRYQLEHLVPLVITIVSIYFMIIKFQNNFVYFVGLVISLIGLFIWWSAKITLSENWSAGYGKPQIKNLVINGIYSKISHPLYWGVNITLVGLCFIHLNSFLTIISIIIIIYFFYRMRVETSFLTKKLGKRYIDYRKTTWI